MKETFDGTPANWAFTLRSEMARLGITEARLRRHCWASARISRARLEWVLSGNEGGQWSWAHAMDWMELVRTAWLAK